jgi:hypothetical protein
MMALVIACKGAETNKKRAGFAAEVSEYSTAREDKQHRWGSERVGSN